ncbi:hypothetical protein KM043_001753 [Ampulex compressa]|nr:hypothetical protein KM043_001753 [Ampulex compressa]
MALDGNGIAYHDPHFLNMLEACLRMEITVCRRVLAVRKEAIRKIKMEVRAQLSKRKQVKERTKQAQDNALVLNAVLKK